MTNDHQPSGEKQHKCLLGPGGQSWSPGPTAGVRRAAFPPGGSRGAEGLVFPFPAFRGCPLWCPPVFRTSHGQSSFCCLPSPPPSSFTSEDPRVTSGSPGSPRRNSPPQDVSARHVSKGPFAISVHVVTGSGDQGVHIFGRGLFCLSQQSVDSAQFMKPFLKLGTGRRRGGGPHWSSGNKNSKYRALILWQEFL